MEIGMKVFAMAHLLSLFWVVLVLTTVFTSGVKFRTEEELACTPVPSPGQLNRTATDSETAWIGNWTSFLQRLDDKIASYEIQKKKIRRWRTKSTSNGHKDPYFKGLFINHCTSIAMQEGIGDQARCSDLNYVTTFKAENESLERRQLTQLMTFHSQEQMCSFNSATNRTTISGNFLVLSEIMQMSCIQQPFSTLVLIAYEKLFIDKDIAKGSISFFSSLENLVLISPKWELNEEPRIIDLSGKDSSNYAKKARINQAGLAGLHGENGGIFVGVVSEINGPSLQLISNGGNGGHGQDGGMGLYGTPGNPPVISNIKCGIQRKRFSQSSPYIEESVYNWTGPVSPKKCIRGGSQCEWYAFGGSLGEPGKDGRDGGDAGVGGSQGFVYIFGEPQNLSLKITAYDGKCGEPGKEGNGGLGGTTGVYKIAETVLAENKCVIKFLSENELHGPATLLEYPKLAAVLPVNTARAASGKPGSRGKVSKRVASQPPTSETFRYLFQKLVALRLDYLREYKHPIRSPPIEFLSTLDNSEQFVKQIPIDVFFATLFQAEESFKVCNNGPLVTPIYQSLQRRLEVAKRVAVGHDKETIEYLLAGTNSRLFEINDQEDYVLITDLQQYLESAVTLVDGLQGNQKISEIISAIGKLEKTNNGGIEKQIEEIRETIVKDIFPLINTLRKKLDIEISSLNKDLQNNKQSLITERNMESSITILRWATKVTNVITIVLGKLALSTHNSKIEMVSVVTGVAAVGFEYLESMGPTHEVITDHTAQLKQEYHKDSKILLKQFIDRLKDVTRKFYADQYLNKTCWEMESLSKRLTTRLSIVEAADLTSRTVEMEAKRLERIQADLKNSTRNLQSVLRGASRELEEQITEASQEVIQRRIKILENAVIEFSGSELYKRNSVVTTDESKERNRAEVYLKTVKAQTDLEQTAENFIGSFSGGFLDAVQNQSITQTDLMSTQLLYKFDQAEHILQKISSSLHHIELKEIELTIKRLRNAVSNLATKYHHLEECQKRITLNSFLTKLDIVNHCNTDTINLETCKNKLKISEILLSNTIRRFSREIYDYVKVWTFPFTQPLEKVQHFIQNSSISSMSEMVKLLYKHVTRDESTIRKQDSEVILTEDYEYYAWNGTTNPDTIRRLLAGETVILDADICRSNKFHDVIKFREVTLNFTSSNPKVQELLQSISPYKLYMKHTGLAYYRYREKYYTVSSNSVTLTTSLSRSMSRQYSVSSKKLSGNTPVLSPYTLWQVQICKDGCKNGVKTEIHERGGLEEHLHEINISLIGSGSHVEGSQQNVEAFLKPVEMNCN